MLGTKSWSRIVWEDEPANEEGIACTAPSTLTIPDASEQTQRITIISQTGPTGRHFHSAGIVLQGLCVLITLIVVSLL